MRFDFLGFFGRESPAVTSLHFLCISSCLQLPPHPCTDTPHPSQRRYLPQEQFELLPKGQSSVLIPIWSTIYKEEEETVVGRARVQLDWVRAGEASCWRHAAVRRWKGTGGGPPGGAPAVRGRPHRVRLRDSVPVRVLGHILGTHGGT